MKKLKYLIPLVVFCFILTGCNYDIVDMHYDYDYAECYLNGEYQKYEIKSWTDYDGEQIQVKAKDGNTYLLSMNYCRLVDE